MRISSTVIFTSLLLAAMSCGGGKSAGAEADADNADDSLAAVFDNLDSRQMIAWRAAQGMPLYSNDIDTLIAYFQEAEAWIGRNIKGVRTRADFDRLDSAYMKRFPFIEVYSSILESYAPDISEQQMELLQAAAISMGNRLDSASRVAGMDPSDVTPIDSQQVQ